MEKIKIFPKIYNILSKISIENNNDEYSIDYFELIKEIDKYFEYCKNVKLNINDNNYEKLSNLILIGSEISLIVYFYGQEITNSNVELEDTILYP